MKKKKIILIEDSALMRRVVSDIINNDDNLMISKIAINGLQGLDILLSENDYDAVLLDINMPRLSGLELLEKLPNHKKKNIIMSSTLTTEGSKETIQALFLGAVDFITKPDSIHSAGMPEFKKQLIETLYAILGLEKKEVIFKENIKKHSVSKFSKPLIMIASSTGGPKALMEVIPKLPRNIGAPVVVVQHMPKGFTKMFSERLAEASSIEVKEVEDGEIIRKNCVYIAKGGYQFRLVKRGMFTYASLSDEKALFGLRPCADETLVSLIEAEYDHVICVVLTGMGSDASIGVSKLIAKKSSKVIVQNKETCVVYGMPKSVEQKGLADEVLPLESISNAIIRNLEV